MGKIISIANHKGGVGKTTSVACIGVALHKLGKRVLLVDLDAQANLTSLFINLDQVEDSIYDSIISYNPLPIVEVKENLDLIPAELSLARAEVELSSRIAREKILSILLAPIKDKYDYILLDCPPSLGLLTTNALTSSDEVFIPLTAEALPLRGMKMIEDVIEEIQRSINPQLSLNGVIVTRYNNRKLNKEVLSAIRNNYGERVFSTYVRENISLAEVPLYGGDIFSYSPDSNGAEDYLNIAQEIINR